MTSTSTRLPLRAFLGLVAVLALPPSAAAQESAMVTHYREVADRIIDAALADSSAYERLALLTDKFGHRFSGSESLEQALDWILEEMAGDGLENVHGEEVMVPHWVRGQESAALIEPRPMPLRMLSLGNSVGTPPEGVEAEVLKAMEAVEDPEVRAKLVPDHMWGCKRPLFSNDYYVAFNRPDLDLGECRPEDLVVGPLDLEVFGHRLEQETW